MQEENLQGLSWCTNSNENSLAVSFFSEIVFISKGFYELLFLLQHKLTVLRSHFASLA